MKAFIKYSNDKDDIYKNIEEYNRNNNNFYEMIADMLSNKKLNPIVTELLFEVES